MAYVFLAPKSELKNLNSISSSSKVFNKELLLTKYQPNNSEVYVNLLEANTRESTSKTKPITHLLVNVNIYALDTTINFDRYQIPGEMMNDLRYGPLNLKPFRNLYQNSNLYLIFQTD